MLFLLQHDYEHALSFLNHYRDHYSGSDFATSLSIDILLRQGKEQKALQLGFSYLPQVQSKPKDFASPPYSHHLAKEKGRWNL